MNKLLTISVLALGFGAAASADVWSWIDAAGDTHFVDTMTPIYTWVDESGEIHYSDSPDHEDAVSVELVWHSGGSLTQVQSLSGDEEADEDAYPGETEEQRAERKRAEAYYCQRANEIYESYVNAPQLFRTGEDGEREYLSKQDAAKKIAETRAKRDELCS